MGIGMDSKGREAAVVFSSRTEEGLWGEFEDLLRSQGVFKCFMCRTCTSSCPVSAVAKEFDPLKIIRMLLYGLGEDVIESQELWLCTSCYACQERCPQGVMVTDLITRLKNIAMSRGKAPAGVKAQKEIITGAGRIYPLDDFDNKKRAKVGLPELPTTCAIVEKIFETAAEESRK